METQSVKAKANSNLTDFLRGLDNLPDVQRKSDELDGTPSISAQEYDRRETERLKKLVEIQLFNSEQQDEIEIPETKTDINATGKYGRSQLHIAVLNEDVEMVSTLLEAGIDISITDSSHRTALDKARTMVNQSDKFRFIIELIEKIEKNKLPAF